jgi:hypothetical protein
MCMVMLPFCALVCEVSNDGGNDGGLMASVISMATPPPGANELLDAALRYAAAGWRVFPVHSLRGGVCTCGEPSCDNPGKHPLTQHGLHDATNSEAAILRWWNRWPDANIGIRAEDIGVVIDVDPRNGGDASLDRLIAEYGPLPDTVEVLTGGGGTHYYLSAPTKLAKGKLPGYPGIDVQAAGSYIIAPPSLHKSGQRYEFEASSDFLLGQQIGQCPGWLFSLRGAAPPTSSGERRHVELTAAPAAALAELRAALSALDPDIPYDEWVRVGQAIHSQGWIEGLDTWSEWSAAGKKWPGHQRMARKWASFNADGGVNISTVYYMARQAGWKGSRQEEPPPAADAPYKLKRAKGSFLTLAPIKWVIEGFVAAGEIVTFAGQPGVGKSTAFAGIGLVVAGFGRGIGSNLQNDRLRKVIIVSEHPEQYQRLIYGFIAKYRLDGEAVMQRVAIYDTARLKLNEVDREFTHLIEEHSVGEYDPPLIIMDTASASFDLANENDNAEVGGMLAAIKRPVARTGSPLWIIAHAAKALGREDADITPRGASAYMGDVHGTASVFREKDRPDSIFIRSLKNRNQREFDEIEMVTTVEWHEVVDERGVIQRQGIRIAAPMVAEQSQAQRFADAKAANHGTKLQAAKAYVVDYLEARPGEIVTLHTFNATEERGRHVRDMVRDAVAELLRDGVLRREVIDPPPTKGARERLVVVDLEWGKGLWR